MFFACNKTKTAQERLKEEKKAIERFIAKNGFEVTNNPDRMSEDNVYYKTKEGLYIHIIDKGNENKVENNQEVAVRYRDLIFFKTDDTTKHSNEAPSELAVTFRHQNALTYGRDAFGVACIGLDIGLALVSDNAEVSLIVPSELQASGWQSAFDPMFFGYIKYRLR